MRSDVAPSEPALPDFTLTELERSELVRSDLVRSDLTPPESALRVLALPSFESTGGATSEPANAAPSPTPTLGPRSR